jgi:hypothetical protein
MDTLGHLSAASMTAAAKKSASAAENITSSDN